MKKKNITPFIIGFIAGLFIWFLIDLIWDWEGNVEDYNRGYNAAKSKYSEIDK